MSRTRSEAGRCVVIAGPDGTGKSTVSEELRRRLPGQYVVFHSRPSVLPQRTRGAGPVTDPHRQAPYGRLLSIAKVLYLWIDYAVGWFVLVRPALRRGATVVIERGWWDLAVDQTRYRLNVPPRLIHRLGMLLPRPHRTLILSGDADVIRRRKPELPLAELERQLGAWWALPAAPLRAELIDVNGPPDRVVSLAIAAAFE
jgi:thymidylate kinase